MGVPGLHTWLKRRYPDAFVQLPAGGFDHVYIDMSSTLHQVIRRARTKQYFHALLHRRLDEILAVAQPRQRVVLALDGPAPLAKLLEQRRRRRREAGKAQRGAAAAATASTASADDAAASSSMSSVDSLASSSGSSMDDGGSGAASAGGGAAIGRSGSSGGGDPELSTLGLTTGSLLMLEVHASLAAYICKKLADPATAHLRFELSDSTVKGEGELKILSRLLHPGPTIPAPAPATLDSSMGGSSMGGSSLGGSSMGGSVAPQETHLVLGADSDLLLMALVAGQTGVYILPDMIDDRKGGQQQHRHGRRHHHRHQQQQQQRPGQGATSSSSGGSGRVLGSMDAEAVGASAAAAAELLRDSAAASGAVPISGSSGSALASSSELSPSESDGEAGLSSSEGDSGTESEGEGGTELALTSLDDELLQPSTAAAAAVVPAAPLLAFSRDAAERIWREQHLAWSSGSSGSSGLGPPTGWQQGQQGQGQGQGQGQPEVTSLALDLMLLSVLCSGNDYLPAIQGLQLSNKHRPGLWDLYNRMRQEPRWLQQALVQRSCGCGGAGAGASPRDCPTVYINREMVGELLREYHRQRFVFMEPPPPDATLEAAAAAVMAGAAGGSGGGSSGGGSAATRAGGGSAADACTRVWDEESLSAAAALAASSASADDEVAGGGGRRQQRRSVTLRGMEPQPASYIEGLEWVLQMYCSGAVRDYRFMYDVAAPSLTELLDALQQAQQRADGLSSSVGSSSGSGSGSSAGRTGGADGQAAAAAAVQQQGEGQAAAPPRRRSLQPLLPAACAMALLPRGGRMHAATALQHLMDEGGQLDDIYATCQHCADIGQKMGSMSRELEGVRAELATAQLHLSTAITEAAMGVAGAVQAVMALESEVGRLEGEQQRLRALLSALSRTQQDHLYEAHPYKPFPTEVLEAAVAAVPLDSYPRRERKLAQFGREFVYSQASASSQQQQQQQRFGQWGRRARLAGAGAGAGGIGRRRPRGAVAAAADSSGESEGESESEGEDQTALLGAAAGAGGEGGAPLRQGTPPQRSQPPLEQQQQRRRQWAPLQPWIEDCLSFAAAYPRVADPSLIRRSNWRVQRDVLPLRPYMQPPYPSRQPDGTYTRPTAVMAQCQLMCWEQQHAQRAQQTAGAGSRSLQGPSHRLPAAAAPPRALRRATSGRWGLARRPPRCHGHTQLMLAQSPSTGGTSTSSGGGGSSGYGYGVMPPRVAARVQAPGSVRSALLQGCTRLLGNLRNLRAL